MCTKRPPCTGTSLTGVLRDASPSRTTLLPHLSWLICRAGLSTQVALTCSAVHRVLMVLALPAVPLTSLRSQRVPVVVRPQIDNAKRAGAAAAESPKRPRRRGGGGGGGQALIQLQS